MTDIMTIISKAFGNLKTNGRFFVSEADFQCSLAMEIKDKLKEYNVTNAQVILEFPVIIKEHKIYIDIMVVVGNKMYPIELKYKTLKISPEENSKSDEKYQNTGIPITDILENQGAQDLGCYGFWRDINRIETLIQDYDNVPSGVCIFITNDAKYVDGPKENTQCYDFRISKNEQVYKAGTHCWKNKGKKFCEKYPDLTINNDYTFNWEDYPQNYNNCKFQYLFIEINNHSKGTI